MEAREFQKQLDALIKEFDADASNAASHNLVDCERCTNCVFCRDCDRCYRCTHCEGCSSSSHLTHCVGCTSCHQSANSVQCTSCSGSAFLVMCSDMSECNYCFGCVGLSRKDFHILNEPYGRTEYFEITKRLRKQLRLPG